MNKNEQVKINTDIASNNGTSPNSVNKLVQKKTEETFI